MHQQAARSQFITITKAPETEIRLDKAALAIAAETDEVNTTQCLTFLNQAAERFGSIHHTHCRSKSSITRLSEFIHTLEGFTGNVESYYDVNNSYLNRVIQTRRGIPITLALIHLTLGERLAIPTYGINFPGHFLVKYGDEQQQIIVDPFSGRTLSETDCANLLKQVAGAKAVLQPHHFDIATKKAILLRILDNLKQIFWRNKDWDKSKLCVERQLLLRPDQAEFSVQLGAIYEMQGDFVLAQHTYTSILQRTPNKQLSKLTQQRLLAMQGTNPIIH